MPIKYDAMDADFDVESNQLQTKLTIIQPEALPETLHHYTSSSGLLGILNSKVMWATNYRFLNDSSEITYGADLLSSIISELLKTRENSDVVTFLERCKLTHNAFDGILDCYVSCLCEDSNLLSQWREYASQGGGFALGFEASRIGLNFNMEQKSRRSDIWLCKVIYDEVLQREIITDILIRAISVIEKAQEKYPNENLEMIIARSCKFVRVEVFPYLACFKHRCFSVEKEWRVIHFTGPSDTAHVKFREGNYGLTPFVELDIKPTVGAYSNRLPLRIITVGPTSDPKNTKYALELLLKNGDYFMPEIVGSNLPVRKI